MDKKKPAEKLKKALYILVLLMVGAAFGIFFVASGEHFLGGEVEIIQIFIMMALMLLGYFLDVIIHESGHLVFGLLTGYRFSSFRILSLLLVKKEGKYRFCRFSIPGTLGQCLLIPPERKEDGSYPYILYNLGGIAANLITAAVTLPIVFLSGIIGWGAIFLSGMGAIALLQALENGIPLGGLGITNDGANIKATAQSPLVRDALWRMLAINALQTEGILLQDMPEELFTMPTDEEMADMWVSSRAVFVENLLVEKMETEKARELIEHLFGNREIRLIPVYRDLLELDLISFELLMGEKPEVSKTVRKNLKNYVMFPSAIRTSYGISLLIDGNEKAADRIRKTFEKAIRDYPFSTDKLVEPRFVDRFRSLYEERKAAQA